MSAEPRPTTHADIWTTWQDQVVQGRFVLRRCLGWSDHGAVFLTEDKAKNLAEAAIKFVRADAPQAQPLLVQWQAAVNLSHPHLVQLFEVGRWQAEGQDYLFVVMEYADQTLAEILRHRALSAEEVQELLPPVLEALTFLHRRQLVHGRLKPSNFLAVGDQLKLASDTIRPAGQDHAVSTAGDVWNFGATLVEALTARARISIDQRFDVASLPAGLPATLVETLKRCLSPTPADRPSIIELRAENNKPAPAAPAAKPEPPVPQAAVPAQATSRVAISYPPASSPQRGVTPPQAANSASRVATSSQPAPSTPREVTPTPSTNVAPRVASQPQVTSSTAQEIRPPRPAPNISPGVVAPQAARTDSRTAAPGQPAPSARREPPPVQVVQTASRVSVSFHAVQPAPSTSRDDISPHPANMAPRVPTPAQPVPTTSREAASAQPANVTARMPAPAESVPGTSREAPPQPASMAPRVGVQTQLAHPASAALRVTAPAQAAPGTSRDAASPQPESTAPRVGVPTQLARDVASAQIAPKTLQDSAVHQTARTSAQVAAPIQPAPSAQREIAPAQPAPTAQRELSPAQPASTNSRVVASPDARTNSQVIVPPATPANSRIIASPAAPTNSRVIAPPAAPTNSRVAAPSTSPSNAREFTPRQPATSVPGAAAPVEAAPKRHFLGIAAGALLLVIAVWIGLRSTNDSPAPLQPAAVPTPVPATPPANIATSEPPISTPISEPLAQLAPPPTSSASVLHEVIPTVPDTIQSKIQGRVYVTVRALVDPAGNVIGVLMENAGPSKYFARISDQAAREWQFVPAETEAARVWLVRFEYTNSGVSVRTFEQ